MPADQFYLSDDDRRVLFDLIEERRNRSSIPRYRPAVDFAPIEQTRGVYVGRTTSSLPALYESFETGTGTNGDGATPGFGTASVYQLLPGSEQLFGIGVFVYIYNLLDVQVPDETWILSIQDTFGTWYCIEMLASDEEDEIPETGTGTGTFVPIIPTFCDLAGIKTTDCLWVYGYGQSLYLYWDHAIGRWISSDHFVTGTGTFTYDDFTYPNGSGPVELWFSAGSLHLSINGMELLNCGDGCFQGGPLTGHASQTSGKPCNGETFTVCVKCASCPPEETGTGTGTGAVSAPCSEIPQFQLQGVISNSTGNCANPAICPGFNGSTNFSNLVSGMLVFSIPTCELEMTLTVNCVDGQLVVSSTGKTPYTIGTIVAFSSSPFVLVVDFSTTTGQFCFNVGSGSFRITITEA
jgi:hypothetical protein